jgi:hypothetical protein
MDCLFRLGLEVMNPCPITRDNGQEIVFSPVTSKQLLAFDCSFFLMLFG